jgi:hypothetical protein
MSTSAASVGAAAPGLPVSYLDPALLPYGFIQLTGTRPRDACGVGIGFFTHHHLLASDFVNQWFRLDLRGLKSKTLNVVSFVLSNLFL